jgi:hypothetical protein
MLPDAKEQCLALDISGGPDLRHLAIKQAPNPVQAVVTARVKITGMPSAIIVRSDTRQDAKSAGDGTVEIHLTATGFDAAKSVLLPVTGPEYRRYLANSKNIQSQDSTVLTQAKSIVSGEKNAYKAASALRSWVYANITVKADSKTPPSASAALKSREGDSRHKALVYTALARSVGIPTRLVSGIVYQVGAFRYRMWAESFVGTWVPFDLTEPDRFVNALHVKLMEHTDYDSAKIALVQAAVTHMKSEVLSHKVAAVPTN